MTDSATTTYNYYNTKTITVTPDKHILIAAYTYDISGSTYPLMFAKMSPYMDDYDCVLEFSGLSLVEVQEWEIAETTLTSADITMTVNTVTHATPASDTVTTSTLCTLSKDIWKK